MEIESPFNIEDPEEGFVADFQELLEKYGFHHYHLLYAEPDSKGKAHWYGIFDTPTIGLLEVLEEQVESMKEQFGL